MIVCVGNALNAFLLGAIIVQFYHCTRSPTSVYIVGTSDHCMKSSLKGCDIFETKYRGLMEIDYQNLIRALTHIKILVKMPNRTEMVLKVRCHQLKPSNQVFYGALDIPLHKKQS